MNIIGSSDISVLQVQATFDISGNNPVISLVNMSSGAHLNNVSYAFIVKSPSQTFIHNGNIDQPDIIGVWSAYVLADVWPRPFNQIEWSGAQYSFQVVVKDHNGNVYTCPVQLAGICRPNGNFENSKTSYGIATSDVAVKCQDGRVFFQDTTYHTYKGEAGTQISSILKVIYPIDETQNIPDPFQIADYSTALVPITYSSDNYQFLQNSIYEYDQGDYVLVRIKYQTIRTFPVWCNIDLAPLVCEFNKLIDDAINGNCQDAASAYYKIGLITGKMAIISMGIQQPLIGVNVPGLIEEIKQIGGFDCDCCSAPTGIIPTSASIIDGYVFSVVGTGGDVNGSVYSSGNNIQFRLHDTSYIVTMGVTSPVQTSAFSFSSTVTGNGFNKTYYLNIDGAQLAKDVLANIASNADALNTLKSLIGVPSMNLIVDGGCIFETSVACDYTFGLSHIPLNTTYAILSGIMVNNVGHNLSYSFNVTNLTGLQTYLNSLGFGSFAVTNSGSGNITITSAANINNLNSLSYKVAAVNYLAVLNKNCTGYVPVDANLIVQRIINYLCGLDDSELNTSQEYVICYLNPTTGVKSTATVLGGTSLTSFIHQLLSLGCNTIDYIKTISSVGTTCNSMKSLFPSNNNEMQESDFFFITKGGVCSRISPIEAATRQLQLGIFDTEFLSAFCTAVAICQGSADCPSVINFEYNFSGSNLYITKAIFNATTGTSQTITILYKLSTDSVYTLYSNSIVVNTDGSLVITAVIPIVSGQTYDVQMLNNCTSPADGILKIISTSGTPEGHEYILGNDSSSICDGGLVTLYTNGPFSIGGVVYTDNLLTNPQTGYIFIYNVINGHIYNINNSTGVVGSDTGLVCHFPATDVIVDNQSANDIVVSSVFVNTVEVIGGSFPVGAGDSTTAGTDQLGTFTVAITITTPLTGDCLQITGSNGATYGQGIAGSNIYTFTNIVVSSLNPITIIVTDGACP